MQIRLVLFGVLNDLVGRPSVADRVTCVIVTSLQNSGLPGRMYAPDSPEAG